MDIKEIIKLAGGETLVGRACGVSKQAVHAWKKNNRLPYSEYASKTQYAMKICNILKALGYEIEPIDLCPGAGQYMESTKKDMRKMEANQ